MDRIVKRGPEDMQVVVEPGSIHRTLNKELAKHGCFFLPDPAAAACALSAT